MTGTVGDSGDTWGLCPLSPGWALIDKELIPLGTWDSKCSRRQVKTEKCPRCPECPRRHRRPFVSPRPTRLQAIDIEWFKFLILGTAELKLSPICPRVWSRNLPYGDSAHEKPVASRRSSDALRLSKLYPNYKPIRSAFTPHGF